MRFLLPIAMLTLLVSPDCAQAGAVISMDMDPLTPGIQSTTTVTMGSTFTVEVVINDDGTSVTPTIFDTLLLELSYNDSGAVLGAGPTGYLAGALAGINPGTTLDLFGTPFPQIAVPGVALTANPASPSAGFASTGGAVGMFVLPPSSILILPGQPISVLSFDLVALAAGESHVLPSGTPTGNPVLSLFGQPVAAEFVSGSVIVERSITPIPEPQGFVLAGIGAFCLAVFCLVHKKRSASVG